MSLFNKALVELIERQLTQKLIESKVLHGIARITHRRVTQLQNEGLPKLPKLEDINIDLTKQYQKTSKFTTTFLNQLNQNLKK
ncbi:hypothetical protein K502DRAFT_349192 [Neoconidiobolus thromboides FSU 785]|nr:hypothetical protein K502DRAFT_349192 [Neoconidiobolus thromboides FSU 785]